jgi:hypothetical protein
MTSRPEIGVLRDVLGPLDIAAHLSTTFGELDMLIHAIAKGPI